ncbi:MAG: hypothetical protein WCS73_09015 [Lentisphaeria bacterium]
MSKNKLQFQITALSAFVVLLFLSSISLQAQNQPAPLVIQSQKNAIEQPGQIKDILAQKPEFYSEKVETSGYSPLAIGIVPPIQLPGRTWDVFILRINIFAGVNNNVQFFDVGVLGNITLGDMTGLEVCGIWNKVNLKMTGLQIGGFGNTVKGNVIGAQIASFVNYNSPITNTKGLQISCANFTGVMDGVQIGLYNYSKTFSGVQIGVVNFAENLSGLQIGLLNIIQDSNVPLMIGLNLGF